MTNPRPGQHRSTIQPELGEPDISPAIAAEILLKRRRVRRSLIDWCRHCGYEPAPHHRLLIDRLERVARGEIKRLAVFMPPGSAKSTYGSILFPALCDGGCTEPRNPCGHADDRARHEMRTKGSQPARGPE